MHEEKSWRVTIRSNLSVPKYIFYCKTSKERINVVNGNWGIAPSPPCDTENGICSFAFFLILTLCQFFFSLYKFWTKKDNELKWKSCIRSLHILQPHQFEQEFIIRKWKLNSKIKSEYLNNEIIDPELNMHWQNIVQCKCSIKFNYLQKWFDWIIFSLFFFNGMF